MLLVITCYFLLWSRGNRDNLGQILRPSAVASRRLDFGPAQAPPVAKSSHGSARGRSAAESAPHRCIALARATRRRAERSTGSSAEAQARLPRHLAKAVGAIYVRFRLDAGQRRGSGANDTRIRRRKRDLRAPRARLFRLGVEGTRTSGTASTTSRRPAGKKVKVLLLFATNRLFRKVIAHWSSSKRSSASTESAACSLSGVDSANKDQWQMLLHMRAIMDEFQVKVVRSTSAQRWKVCFSRDTCWEH